MHSKLFQRVRREAKRDLNIMIGEGKTFGMPRTLTAQSKKSRNTTLMKRLANAQ